MFNVGRALTVAAERSPDAEAVIEGDQRLRYGSLEARANRLAGALLGLGLGKGDHAVFLLKNRVLSIFDVGCSRKGSAGGEGQRRADEPCRGHDT